MNDEFWMRKALAEAQNCHRLIPDSPASASATGPMRPDNSHHDSQNQDVPVGAICVLNQKIVGRGHNRRVLDLDPSAHAEILALKAAAQWLQTSNLSGVTLYVSLEPCPMCAGALWLCRVSRLVFGAWDDKAGACGSVFDIVRDPRLNHRLEVRGGVLEPECAALLRDFFVARRN